MQAREKDEIPPVGVIFDSDMGNSIDDVLALAMLYGFAGLEEPEARVVSVSVTKSNLKAAAFCEAVGNFYLEMLRAKYPPRFRRGRSLPTGFSDDGRMSEDTPMLTEPLAKLDSDGKPVYTHEIHQLNDTAEVAALIRNAFTAQHDLNSVVVLTGPATNLARVLTVHGAPEWIQQKVRFLAVSAGAYPEGGPEFNIQSDIDAAKKLFAEWPTPIVAAGSELGEQLLYPATSIEEDFTWAPSHPVVDAYLAYRPMPYDAPTFALAAALSAVRPDDGYFGLSEPGTITVLDDGRTKFEPQPDGKHRYLILDPAKKDRIVKAYIELVSARPHPMEPPGFLKRLLEEEEEEKKKKKEQEAAQKDQSSQT